MSRIILTHANLLDGEHPAKPDSTVVIEEGRISGVDPVLIEQAADDQVIDCTGRSVMPGMVQGHYHSTYRGVTAQLTPPLGLENPPAYQAYVAAENVRIALVCGFTSVVGANEAWDIDPSLARAVEERLVLGPRVVAGSRELITSADSNDIVPWWYEARALGGVRICNGPDEFRRAVREEVKRGAEIIKMFATGGHGVRLSSDTSSITRSEFQAAVEAAHSLGKRVRAHVASKRAIMTCLEVGVDVLDHADGLDEECLRACAEAGTIVIPSLFSHYLLVNSADATDPVLGTSSELARNLKSMIDVLPTAVEAGVRVCLGDDYGSFLIPHGEYGRELQVYVEAASIPALEVLRWATVNGGALVGLDNLGRIEEGAIADVLVVQGDPSTDISVLADRRNIHVVISNGEVLVSQDTI
jgi:imidazolonepropionase-like amidohydrolase